MSQDKQMHETSKQPWEAIVTLGTFINKGELSKVKETLCLHPELLHHQDKEGKTWLHKTCMHGQVAIAAYLIELGCSLTAIAKGCGTALDLALQLNQQKLLKLLWEANRTTALSNTEGLTRLDDNAKYVLCKIENELKICINTSDVDKIKLIFQIYPDIVNYQNSNGETWLHQACYKNRYDVATNLIKLGCNINIKGSSGTALDVALQFGEQRIMDLLIGHHGQTVLSNFRQDKPVDEMTEPILTSICKELKNCFTREGGLDRVKAIFKTYPEILNYLNYEGKTWLHQACINKKPKIVDHLINLGCILDIPDIEDITPFQDAVSSGDHHIVKLMLLSVYKPVTKGEDLNCRSQDLILQTL